VIPPERAGGLLAALNPAQQEAVAHGDGPVLVLAGAGSGKTRVITHRIAWLVSERREDPWRIVAVTFTNKAAGEMRERVHALLGDAAEGMWVGTFHALCLRMLRRDGARVGLAPGFNVYDTDDQLALVKRILKEMGVEEATEGPRAVLSRISRAKNAMESPSSLEKRAFSPDAKLVAQAFALYEDGLKRANAADFDDLLLRALDLLDPERNPETLEAYASRCRHLLVDEYQDTNRPQYLLVRGLSSHHGNVFVVGDEDQSIYKFRGAEIRNILDFERDHPGARTVKLEQNYRSTGTILDVAGAVISHNTARKGKRLWTENARGDAVELFRAPDDRAEATWIARRVREWAASRAFEDVSVLYRTNAQSRQLEEAFRRDKIPYQVVGAVQFYERKEVKDVLAYLKLLANPADDVAFRRIVNTPARGVGDGTLRVVDDVARTHRIPLLAAARRATGDGLIPSRSARMLQAFVDLVDELSALASEEPAALVLEAVLERAKFEAHLEKSHPGEAQDRIENVRALVSAAVEYEKEAEDAGLAGFLDRSALVSDADEVGARPGVTLMTIHCAKGLEFPAVFLAGLEENLFPHARSTASSDDLEEERRLCYVAMTRARERLFLSHAYSRLQQGVPMSNAPSRFLDEVPAECLEETGGFPWAQAGRAVSPREPSFDAWGSSAARAAARPNRSPVSAGPSAASGGPPPADGFAVGATVEHPMFGAGRILDREGDGKGLKLTIHFVGYGKKRILPAYTTLEVAAGQERNSR
jgi:DNA helicase-2/ATP-dependent DNA helicase PcrA